MCFKEVDFFRLFFRSKVRYKLLKIGSSNSVFERRNLILNLYNFEVDLNSTWGGGGS